MSDNKNWLWVPYCLSYKFLLHWIYLPTLDFAEGSYDTKADDVMARSFIPSLLTFEEEIVASLKDNTPAQTDKT